MELSEDTRLPKDEADHITVSELAAASDIYGLVSVVSGVELNFEPEQLSDD